MADKISRRPWILSRRFRILRATAAAAAAAAAPRVLLFLFDCPWHVRACTAYGANGNRLRTRLYVYIRLFSASEDPYVIALISGDDYLLSVPQPVYLYPFASSLAHGNIASSSFCRETIVVVVGFIFNHILIPFLVCKISWIGILTYVFSNNFFSRHLERRNEHVFFSKMESTLFSPRYFLDVLFFCGFRCNEIKIRTSGGFWIILI